MASFNLKDEADTSSQDIVLECCFCSHLFEDEFRHPRLLSCLHSICFQCLQGKINSNAKINCRFCKEEIDFSDKTIEQFPRDETKSNFVKLYKVKHSKYVLQCQECEDGQTSEFLCETCSKQLCKDCHEHHKRAKRSHILYSLQDMPLTFNSVKRFATTRKCQMKGHDEEKLTFYCNSCKQTVCSRCTLIAHKEGHHVQELHEVYETEIQKVKNEKMPLDELEIRIDNIINSVELEIGNVEKTSDGILSQIEATYNERVESLTRRKLELMEELEQEKSVKTERLLGQLLQLKNQKSIVSSTKHFINLSLSTADTVSFIDASPLIIQKASSIRDTQIDMAPCEKPTFGFFETPLESTPLLGRMTSASIYGPKTIVTIPEENCLGEETEIKVDLYDYGGNVVNDEALDVSLQIYDTNNKLVHSISCYLTDGRTWFSKSILPAAGRYEIAVVVLGVRLDMETVNIEIKDMQVLECAQIPVFLSQRMDNDRTIQITDIHTGLSDEDIIRYFQNNKQSGGGKIHKFSRVENDIFITFQDERVLRRVLCGTHRIDWKLLKVSEFKGPVLKVPDPIVLDDLDETKIRFVKKSGHIRQHLEQELEKMFAKIVWPDEAQDEIVIFCMLTIDTENYETFAKAWSKDVSHLVFSFIDELIVKQITVPEEIWEPFVDALQYIDVSKPDNVSLVLRKNSATVNMVGYRNDVDELEMHVKEALKHVNAPKFRLAKTTRSNFKW